MRLKGKKALITGGSSGIGLATAIAFNKEGAKILISGRNKFSLEKACKKIGDDSSFVVADVSNVLQINSLFSEAAKYLAQIDVLVVNAGVAKVASVEETSEAIFDEIVNINLKGTYFTVQKAIPLLSKGASVILVSSALGNVGANGLSVYAATKAGIRSLSRSFSSEFLEKEIRVNTLSPGPTETPIFERMGSDPEQLDRHIKEDIPVQRMGTPEEIARAAIFLATSDSSYMLGSELVVDGGHSQI
tara:strand:- start:1256 stop:1993 length:738 start_codon:yes stop_codon:yes gene_type:complete